MKSVYWRIVDVRLLESTLRVLVFMFIICTSERIFFKTVFSADNLTAAVDLNAHPNVGNVPFPLHFTVTTSDRLNTKNNRPTVLRPTAKIANTEIFVPFHIILQRSYIYYNVVWTLLYRIVWVGGKEEIHTGSKNALISWLFQFPCGWLPAITHLIRPFKQNKDLTSFFCLNERLSNCFESLQTEPMVSLHFLGIKLGWRLKVKLIFILSEDGCLSSNPRLWNYTCMVQRWTYSRLRLNLTLSLQILLLFPETARGWGKVRQREGEKSFNKKKKWICY